MSTPTLSVVGALPVTPETAMLLYTAAPASGICTSAVFSKYLPVGGGVPPICWLIQSRYCAMPVYSVVVAHSPLLSPGPWVSPTSVQLPVLPVIAGPPESPWHAE